MERLKKWFRQHQREFTWRLERTPYKVWIAETMLQQTRATVVEEYFARWMIQFPTIQTLAQATEEEVLKCWEGLGYYSRARNLHKGAGQIVSQFGGQFPSTREELLSIRGIGEYTAGAILNFAFHTASPALDANVIRVLSRFTGYADNPRNVRGMRHLTETMTDLIACPQGYEVTEALIELGAMVCVKNPQCRRCPLKSSCKAYSEELTDVIPQQAKRPSQILLYRDVACIQCDNKVLLQKGQKGRVMADLYHFPFLDLTKEGVEERRDLWQKELNTSLVQNRILDPIVHHFTRYKVHLFPRTYQASTHIQHDDYEWISIERLSDLPFVSGHRELRNMYILS